MNKTLIALSAAAFFGSVSASLAYEAPENKIGDRYPALEQTYKPTTATRIFGGTVTPRLVRSQSTAAEVPEHKIGDRYPSLEQAYRPVATTKVAVRKVTYRLAMYGSEVPEHKIGDRFPFLEHVYATQYGSTGRVLTARIRQLAMKN